MAAFTKPASQAPPSWETFGNDYGASAFDSRPEAEDYFGEDPLAAYGKAEDGEALTLSTFSTCAVVYSFRAWSWQGSKLVEARGCLHCLIGLG